MLWQKILINILLVIISYMIGSINWAIIISKFIVGKDVREGGSKNAGSTNMLRQYGARLALPVFLLDICKPLLVAVITISMYNEISPTNVWQHIMPQVITGTVVIGHIWPIWFKFKGGKGSACLLGFLISYNYVITLIAAVIFFLIVKFTKYVSLGSIIAPGICIGLSAIPHVGYNNHWGEPFANEFAWWTNTTIIASLWLLTLFKHRGNILRLIKGTERKIGSKK